MFSLIAYSESQDAAALATVTAVPDTLYRSSGDDIFVPRSLPFLGGFLFVGATLTAGQIWSPSILRKLGGGYDIDQSDLATEPGSPPNFVDLFERPIPLAAGEQLRTLFSESNAGADRATALIFLCTGPAEPIEGDIISVRYTGTTTLVAFAWSVGSISPSPTLPAGRYALVGARVQSAGLLGARFISQDQQFRPGCIGTDADGDISIDRFRRGALGSWLEFEHDEPPLVEYLSVSADTAETLILDLIQVREGVA